MALWDDRHIQSIIKYNTSRAYIGEFTANDLRDAYVRLRTSYETEFPLGFTDVRIGLINGNVICDALWNEMSYNPVRFGSSSPFLVDGRNNIYRFCQIRGDINSPDKTESVLATMRFKLIHFLHWNSDRNGAWRDAMITNAGYVPVGMRADGHANSMYKRLANLRDSIKIIAYQNVADFKDIYGPYRAEIINMVKKRHPDGIRPLRAPKVQPMAPVSPIASPAIEYDNEERVDKAMENLAITMDNQKYFSPDDYAQAVSDFEKLAKERDLHTR